MIRVDDITVRTIEEKDIETIFRWNSDEFRGNYQECQFESKQALINQYNKDGLCSDKSQTLLIEEKNTAIGLIYLNFVREGLVDIGIVLCNNKTNKGIGSKITVEIVNYLFSNYNLCRIQANTDINNISAQKVLEKSGFLKEGILKKYRYHHGKYNDSILYSITR